MRHHLYFTSSYCSCFVPSKGTKTSAVTSRLFNRAVNPLPLPGRLCPFMMFPAPLRPGYFAGCRVHELKCGQRNVRIRARQNRLASRHYRRYNSGFVPSDGICVGRSMQRSESNGLASPQPGEHGLKGDLA